MSLTNHTALHANNLGLASWVDVTRKMLIIRISLFLDMYVPFIVSVG